MHAFDFVITLYSFVYALAVAQILSTVGDIIRAGIAGDSGRIVDSPDAVAQPLSLALIDAPIPSGLAAPDPVVRLNSASADRPSVWTWAEARPSSVGRKPHSSLPKLI